MPDGPPEEARGAATSPRIAAFISGHGFGHAARASAVLARLHAATGCRVELFTTAPRWFFEESIAGIFRYHQEAVDVGFRQASALDYDLEATVAALRDFLPFGRRVERFAEEVAKADCRAVLCDISPLGVAVAEAAGLPSIVVENFTWGWLYEPLHARAPELEAFGRELDDWLMQADVHLQARPVCLRLESTELVDPISREPRRPREETRAALGVGEDEKLVVVTMGGYGESLSFLPRLRERRDCRFLVTGADATSEEGNLLLFDNNTPLFMPDLMRAADALVAKLGYGTVSEVWREGLPFLGVTRSDFREMEALEAFARAELRGTVIAPGGFRSGAWIEELDALLGMERRPREGGGASRVVEALAEVAGLSPPSAGP